MSSLPQKVYDKLERLERVSAKWAIPFLNFFEPDLAEHKGSLQGVDETGEARAAEPLQPEEETRPITQAQGKSLCLRWFSSKKGA